MSNRLSAIGFARATRFILGGLSIALLLSFTATARDAASIDSLLKTLDETKTANYLEFVRTVESLRADSGDFSPAQKEYLEYFRGWQEAYEGNFEASIATLKSVVDKSQDSTLRFRAIVTTVNALAIAKRHEDAFSMLNLLLEELPNVTDQSARQQALGVTALMYGEVGEYRLSLEYANKLIAEGKDGRAICRGEQLKLGAQFKSGQLSKVGAELQDGVVKCRSVGETIHANLIRTYMARIYLDQDRPNDAIKLLSEFLDEVEATHYKLLIAAYSSLLASAHRAAGNTAMAMRFANDALANTAKNEYTEPRLNAYRLLYLFAKEQGDTKAALRYHEEYSAVDKGYLDDTSARQLAYQRVKQEVDANRLQIQTLNKENQVLQLQRQLGDKAIENIRLYIVLLFVTLVFIALWAYWTKRSQLHFKNLSRLDGLTGLCNRPHFLDVAERALVDGNKLQQPMCVIICDLDYFKRINDTFGHAAGDTALKQTAAVFQEHLRKLDIVGRLGGEEFAMLLINCDAATALQRCDQMRQAIATIRVGDGAAAFSLTASFGIVSTASAGHELRRLLADADAALYQAKLSGRNRVIQYSSSDVTREIAPDGKPAGLTA